MLVNCNEFDLEGLIAVTGKYLKTRVKPELYLKLIDAYAQVVENLRIHAGGWPDPDYLRGITKAGQPQYGMAEVGEGKSSAGSREIVEAVSRDDPRPVCVVVNAGSNTLAQALWDYRAAHTPEQVKAFVAKLRVYENGAQDDAGAWICHEFPDIHWIRSNHQTYGYMGEGEGKGPYVWKPYPQDNQGQHRWAEEHIMRNHGLLGALYPYRMRGNEYLEGGGTTPWLGLVNKGLYSVDHPSRGGWSGRFSGAKVKNVWSRHADIRRQEEANYTDFYMYAEATDDWTDPESGIRYNDKYTPVYRWRRAMANNCQARFDWCVKPFDQANHPPVAALNGDRTDAILRLAAKPGDSIPLDASASSDPDNDGLAFEWFTYPEAGTYKGSVTVKDDRQAKAELAIPADAAGSQIHLILQVNDKSRIVALYDYRRMVIDVAR